MSTVTTIPESSDSSFSPGRAEAVGPRPIVVATDGTAGSDAALEAAAQLASAVRSKVVVLSVFEPAQVRALDAVILLPRPDIESARKEAQLSSVKNQLARLGDRAAGWTLETRDGDPALFIAREASAVFAQLVIVGSGRHELLDRLLGVETALHTLRACRAPVLAVAPTFDHAPKRVLIATDFSVASIDAARVALHLFPTISVVYLVHVRPRMEMQPEALAARMAVHDEGLTPAFERAKAALGLLSTVTVEASRSQESQRASS